jgi:hypothetical protein
MKLQEIGGVNSPRRSYLPKAILGIRPGRGSRAFSSTRARLPSDLPSTWAAPRPSVAMNCVLAIPADANEPTAIKASVATPAAMKSFLIMARRFSCSFCTFRI